MCAKVAYVNFNNKRRYDNDDQQKYSKVGAYELQLVYGPEGGDA